MYHLSLVRGAKGAVKRPAFLRTREAPHDQLYLCSAFGRDLSVDHGQRYEVEEEEEEAGGRGSISWDRTTKVDILNIRWDLMQDNASLT